MKKSEIVAIFKNAKSKSDVCRQLNYVAGGGGLRKVNEMIDVYKIDISHFDGGRSKRIIYETIEKVCPVCEKTFTSQKGHKREKVTCSYSCSNTFFRSGENNGSWKEDASYRTICFRYHKKECVICGENKIVAVHHYDENHNNNEPDNLIPICPTHHQYVHSRYRDEVIKKIISYRNNFITNIG
jgi:hypothetical protein